MIWEWQTDQYGPILSDLNQIINSVDPSWSFLIRFEPNYDIYFRLLCTNTSRPNGRRQISRELYSSTKENANLALDFWSWIGYQQTTKFNQSLKISNFKTNHHFSSTKRRLVSRLFLWLNKLEKVFELYALVGILGISKLFL